MPHISRSWGRPSRLLSKTEGQIMKSLRPFGIEIECQYNEPSDLEAVVEKIDREIGISGDGSIDNWKDGHHVEDAEITTPPASGEAAEGMIKTLSKALVENGFMVDESCGLHVHIDMKDIYSKPYEYFQKYWLFAIAFDDVIRSFLSLRRRNNGYCKAVDPVFVAVTKAKSMEELRHIAGSSDPTLLDIRYRLTHRKNVEKYKGFNLHPFFSVHNPNVEIRYHNGTINGARMLHWANLHCLIADRVADGTITLPWLKSMHRKTGIRNKTEHLIKTLGLAKPSEIYFKARQLVFFKKYGYATEEISREVAALTANEY